MRASETKERPVASEISDLRSIPISELVATAEANVVVARLMSESSQSPRVPVAAFNSYI
jgi:hypothetical protein